MAICLGIALCKVLAYVIAVQCGQLKPLPKVDKTWLGICAYLKEFAWKPKMAPIPSITKSGYRVRFLKEQVSKVMGVYLAGSDMVARNVILYNKASEQVLDFLKRVSAALGHVEDHMLSLPPSPIRRNEAARAVTSASMTLSPTNRSGRTESFLPHESFAVSSRTAGKGNMTIQYAFRTNLNDSPTKRLIDIMTLNENTVSPTKRTGTEAILYSATPDFVYLCLLHRCVG